MTKRLSTTLENARRLAVTKQHLAGRLSRKPSSSDIIAVFRDLGCVQLDPIRAVAPSHLIVLWSRLGNFNKADLDKLLWHDRQIIEYWAHQASLVLTEDYPLYYGMMRGYPDFSTPWSTGESPWGKRVRRWLNEHADLRDFVFRELREKGPMLSRQFEDDSRVTSRRSGWGSEGNVSRMLFHLLLKGDVMVVGRQGNQRVWGLTERFLPKWVSKKQLSPDEVEHEAVQRSIRALGTATPSEIKYYFLRGRYRNLKATLRQLLDEEKIHHVNFEEGPVGKGERYIHQEDVPLLNDLEADDEWQPRMTLLSPFDNLICDRTRTRLLFRFHYSIEIYSPSHKRKYGYYVLPILYGDRLIGRIDPVLDRKEKRLLVKAVNAEPKAPKGGEVSSKIAKTVEDLSRFLGADEVVYSKRVPRIWRDSLG